MRQIGEKVVLRGKTYEIIGYTKKSYLLKGENGKTYKCGPGKLERLICGIPRAVHRRTTAEMQAPTLTPEQAIERLKQIECELSPENLSCDGELSRTAVQRRYTALMREKRVLEARLGRKLTDQELYGRS